MPIELVTGVPGHGKTQFAIKKVLQLVNKEPRPVFYSRINGLELDWNPFNPRDVEVVGTEEGGETVYRWVGVPDGSIIIIDECHEVYPQRKPGSEVPFHEALLSTHRKLGYDIYLVTQHPKDINANVRRRVEVHYHTKRLQKSNRAVLYEWRDGVIGDISDGAILNADKCASQNIYSYDKKIWDLYKSATVHTVQRQTLPKKLWLAPILIAAIVFGLYYLVDILDTMGSEQPDNDLLTTHQPNYLESPQHIDKVIKTHEAAAMDYIKSREEAIQDYPESAPIYHKVMEYKSFPRPQCVLFNHKKLPPAKNHFSQYPKGGDCRCFTQQGTLLHIRTQRCREIVQRGYFEPTFEDPAYIEVTQETEGGAGLAAPPVFALIRSI